ncbi:MAG: PEP-CTERM sorting domain-containing protein, partial [Acidimicrobiales bacterium]
MTEPHGEASSTSFLDSLGVRAQRRAEPRTSIAIAGAGCALAILGVLIVSGDTGVPDDFSGSFNKVPGVILSLLVVVGGYVALAQSGRGAVATGGTVAAALGVPPLMFFLTFDENGFPPYSTEAILYVSTIAWLASYAVGPGRGRPFFLGAGLLGVWFSLLQLTEELFDFPFVAIDGFFGAFSTTSSFDETGTAIGGDFSGGGFDDPGFGGGPTFDVPEPTTIGLISLGLGVAYLVVGRRLDRRGLQGAGTPVALATIPPLFIGALFLADDLETAGTGLLLMAIGLGLAYSGGSTWRRATTWIGGAATAIGAAVFLGDMTDDATIGGMLFLAAGIGLVFAGHAIATAISEPDEMAVTAPVAIAVTLSSPPTV